jgi:SAM-dependent methyltransferase
MNGLPMTGGSEQPRSYYERFHSDPQAYAAHYRDSVYYPLFRRVAELIEARRLNRILEVGCGSGTLAHLLMDRSAVDYRGFDFSAVAVKRAGARTGRPEVFSVGDARDPTLYGGDYDGIICTEVLEHIENDREVVELWPVGSYCICSVPNFMNKEHVRCFRSAAEVRERYGDLLTIERIIRVPRPLIVNNDFRGYFRRLRWSRGNLRKFLGYLGFRRFDNVAGWFLFVGRRADAAAPPVSSPIEDRSARQ